MSNILCVTVRFMAPDPTFHGTRDGGQPEWPPSPLRLFQALMDAAASRWREQSFAEHVKPAFEWFERLDHPTIFAPGHHVESAFRIAVPNNDLDSPARVWAKGGEPVKPHRPIDLKTMKTVWPSRLFCDDKNENALHYLYPLSGGYCPHLDVLTDAARAITHLGWGVNMAAGDAGIVTDEQAAELSGHGWQPSTVGGVPLRTPRPGTLDDLIRKHCDFLGRLTSSGFRPVPPLRVFDVVRYRRLDQPLQRPYRVFKLRRTDDSPFRYPPRKLIHIAGMLRHLAIAVMKASPPTGVGSDWVETFVAGHAAADVPEHRQLSYLPLPSIGHIYTDPGVRRIMIAAPSGDDAWLSHVARYLAGRMLEPLRGDEFAGKDPPLLVPVRYDNIARRYTQPSNAWASVTPVILPGHDDHKPEKTRRLIEKALQQSEVDQPCEFEWSAFSRFPKSLSAHKYDRDKRPSGYIRPGHLQSQTAVHLTLRFNDNLKVPGPLAIGAGRHCGLGLMAAVEPWWCQG